VAGRTFVAEDRPGREYVTVINQALASQLELTFGITDPVGQLVDLPAIGYGASTTRERMRVVGVVGNERVRSDLRAEILGVAYVPLAQAPILWLKLAARVQGSPAGAVPAIREAVREVDPHVAFADVLTMDQIKERSLSGLREPAWLIGIFAVLSALLAALGLYGVVSHAVAQQRREIGVRLALGAGAADVLALVLRHVLVTVSGGVVLGLLGSVVLTRVTRSLLFDVSPLDPAAFVTAALVMAMIGAIAAAIPASRATRVDPAISLRSDS
jgi:putative ABC transport system permease protein